MKCRCQSTRERWSRCRRTNRRTNSALSSALHQVVEIENRVAVFSLRNVVERTYRAVHELRHIEVRRGEIRDGGISRAQYDRTADCLVARRLVELTLQSCDEESGARRVGVGREDRQARLVHVANDVGLPALFPEDVRDVGEAT